MQQFSAKSIAGVNDLVELVAHLAVHCRGSSAREKVTEAMAILAEAQLQIQSGALARARAGHFPMPTTMNQQGS